jgi:hypothetical protein
MSNVLIGVLASDAFPCTLFQPELYLCTPVKVDYSKSYYIGKWTVL